MRYPRLILLSLTTCAAVIALSGCGGSFVSSISPSNSGGAAPAVVAVGEQVNGVAPNRWQYVQFNEPMDASTINNQTLIVADSSGRPASGTVTYNANYKIAGFEPNPALAASTTYTLTVTTGVASAQGVHMAAAYTSQFTTRASTDTSPIYVKNVTPFPDASCVSPTTPIVITFNEGAEVSTINSSNILVSGPGGSPIEVKIGYDPTTASVTLTPTSPLPSGSISVYVNNVADAAGVAMTNPYMWSFSTACGGSGGGPTTQFMATILNSGGMQMVHGQVTIDTAGNTTVQLTGTAPKATYTVQFCPAFYPPHVPNGVPCFNVMTISTDASGNGTATAKFPKSGDWAGDFNLNDSAGTTDYFTWLVAGSTNETYLATLLPTTVVNGGAAAGNPGGAQEPLQSGSVSYSNGEVQITMKGASPNTSYFISDSETGYLDGSGTYGLQTFTTNAQGDAYANTTISGPPGGDLFEVGQNSPTGNGYFAGFSVP